MNQPTLTQPTYYVRHPDDSYSMADPQPTLAPSRDSPSEGQQAALCPICGGNDMDMPCANPSERFAACPRTKRLAATQAARSEAPATVHPSGWEGCNRELRMAGVAVRVFEDAEAANRLAAHINAALASPPEAQPAEQRKPLTDVAIGLLLEEIPEADKYLGIDDFHAIVRAIERAHGISDQRKPE